MPSSARDVQQQAGPDHAEALVRGALRSSGQDGDVELHEVARRLVETGDLPAG